MLPWRRASTGALFQGSKYHVLKYRSINMAHNKTFRTIYLHEDLEERLQEQSKAEHSSVSRITRLALEMYLKSKQEKNENEEVA